MKYDWKNETSSVKHFYRTEDGKILGTVWQYVNNNLIWCSKIHEDEFPFTNSSEKHIGHFISEEYAKRSVEKHWHTEDSTLNWETDRRQIHGS